MSEESPGHVRQPSPFHCPYCGEEELTPYEDPVGSWLCRSCLRAFSVRLIASGVTQ
jgi:ribosomal protein L37AE/L43A